ncbi:MAG: dethiobiotin synthase [Planctomycetota bacterium]|jgi:dethiobiotin synthetase
MANVIHVVGTDTGVGKTRIAASLARGLNLRGFDTGVCKPFASGGDPKNVPADASVLMKAAGAKDDVERVSPVRFRSPISPWSASREEGREAGLDIASEAIRVLESLHDVLIVEGIGGVAVPIDTGVTYADFMTEHPGDILLVARAGLGTLNHSLLTVEALRTRGAVITGVVLNRAEPGTDPSERSNPAAIEAFTACRILADLPFTDDGREYHQLPDGLYLALSAGEEAIEQGG